MQTKIIKKVVQHKQEWLFLDSIKRYLEQGYVLASEKKLGSDGTWGVLMTKEVNFKNENRAEGKKSGWAKHKYIF